MIKRIFLIATVILLVTLVARPLLSKTESAVQQQTGQQTTLFSVRSAGIPTARNVDHIGLTVPDLKVALNFFVDVLGADVLWVEPEGYGTQRPLNMQGIFNVDPHSSVTISLLRLVQILTSS